LTAPVRCRNILFGMDGNPEKARGVPPVRPSDRRFVIALGLAVSAAYLFVSLTVSGRPHVAVPQLDSLLYYQYARAWAEGHSYCFNPGDAPTTGSTSHLYPLVLAAFYAVGFRGEFLWDAGFVLGMLLFLFFVYGVFRVAHLLEPRSARFAALCAALNGHAALTFFGQTDMGLFAVIFFWSWLFLLRGWYGRGAGILLFLGVLTRPEGGVLAAVLMLLWFSVRSLRRSGAWLAAAGGILGCVVVATLNRGLTGSVLFDSLRGKSVFQLYPLATAVIAACRNWVELVGAALLGIGEGGRSFYTLPILGPLLAGAAVSVLLKGDRRVMTVFWPGLTVAAGLGVVAQSDWVGLVHDRYLLWVIATLVLLAAVGCYQPVRVVADTERGHRLSGFLRVLLGGWLALGSIWHLAAFAAEARRTMEAVRFAEEVGERLPAGARVGMTADSGVAYVMPRNPVVNLSGITTPIFRGQGHILCALEWLKYHPGDRFGYWLIPVQHARLPWLRPLVAEALQEQSGLGDPGERLGLYRARWSALESSVASVPTEVGAWRRVARLDVGYRPDEIAGDLRIGIREPGIRLEPVFLLEESADHGPPVLEVGRFVLGWATMRVPVRVGRPLRIMVRTAQDFTAAFYGGAARMELREVHLQKRIRLRITAGGRTVERCLEPMDGGGKYDYLLELPAAMITESPLRLYIAGDHLACGYFFYQPEGEPPVRSADGRDDTVPISRGRL